MNHVSVFLDIILLNVKEEVLPECMVIGDYEDKINNFCVDAGDVVIKVGEDPLGRCHT